MKYKTYNKEPNNKGVTLVIATIYIAFFMLMLADMATVVLASAKMRRGWMDSEQAFYWAESAQEFGIKWSVTAATGANSEDDPAAIATILQPIFDSVAARGVNCGTEPCVGFEVVGRSRPSDTVQIGGSGTSYYSVPVKGTGDAAKKCRPNSAAVADADHPCNWSRLKLGEAVEIPLYYEDSNGSVVKLFDGFGNPEFKLRIRTPCEKPAGKYEYPENCATWAERVQLWPMFGDDDSRDIKRDKVLMHWIISDFGGQGESLMAMDGNKMDDEKVKRPSLSTTDNTNAAKDTKNKNTELSAGRIEAARDFGSDILTDYTVLEADHYGQNLNYEPTKIKEFIASAEKPTLRLGLIDIPRRDDGNSLTHLTKADLDDRSLDISHLQYQILTTQKPITDGKSTIKSWAQVGDFYKELLYIRKRPVTTGGFVLESN